MTFTVYLLSVIDSLRSVLGPVAVLSGIAATFTTIGVLTFTESNGADHDITKLLRKCWVSAWIVCALASLTCAVTPSLDSLRKAYMYSEAAKLATAPNAERVVGETMKRMDRVLGMFEKAVESKAGK